MKKKRILVRCYEPISIDKTAKQPWSDVWITFKIKRVLHKISLVLISKPDIELNIEFEREFKKEYNFDDNELESYLKVQEELLVSRFTFSNYEVKGRKSREIKEFCCVYCSDDGITRQVAEDMIKYFIRRSLVPKNHILKFVWKRPSIIVCPV